MSQYPEIFRSIMSDARSSGIKRISLVDIIGQYDARQHLAPLLSELNIALSTIDYIKLVFDGEGAISGIYMGGQAANNDYSQ